MKKVLTLTALGVVLLSSTAMASGFHLREQSAAAQGNAFAGATAGAENISYTYFNAAGLTRHKGTQINLGASYIAPEAAAKNVRVVKDDDGSLGARGSDVHNIVHAAVSPNITVSHQINDKSFLGLAINTPYGMITKYDQEWIGSDHGITSDLKTATITPMFAYKATDKLSLGVGMQIQYVWAHLTNSKKPAIKHVTADGDALDFGYQLGALYEFNENTRLGVGYRSQVRHKLKGDMKATMNIPLLNQDISAKLDTPAMLSIGAHHDINDKWAVMAEYQRVFWSSFKNLTFVGDKLNNGSNISQVKENWRDTNFWSLGTSYQMDNQWKLRLGIAYDQSAVRLQHRTPRIPDSDRIWYSVGLGYQYNDKLSFDAGYTYIKAHKAKMNTLYTGNPGNHVSADYTNSVQIFALSVNYNF